MNGNSDVFAVLRMLYLEGLRIDLTASGSPVVKGGQPSEALREILHRHRDEILAVLQEQSIGTYDDSGIPALRRYVTPPDCLATRACSRLGWCSQSLMQHACNHAATESEAA